MATRNLKQALKGGDLQCADLLCCIMGMSSTDAKVFQTVNKAMTVKRVAKAIKKSRSTAQSSLNRLVFSGFLGKASTKSKRGSKYIYAPVDREAVKKRLIRELNTACKKLKQEISER